MLKPLDSADDARAHPALWSDLEFRSLLGGVDDRLHLLREVDRVEAALGAGGYGFQTQTGLILFRDLAWDSEHFGYRCADLCRLYLADDAEEAEVHTLVDAGLKQADLMGIRLLSARLRSQQTTAIHALEARGFRLVDTSVELGGQVNVEPDDPAIQIATASDLAEIQTIADTFVENRFFRDPQISDARATALYRRWVEASVAEDALVVGRDEDGCAAFCTFAPADSGLEVATVGLVAVAPRARGRKWVARLLGAVSQRCPADAIVTSTQVTNAPALRAFFRGGLRPFAARHVFHRWNGNA